MKLKPLKNPGYFRIVCNDEQINKKYGCSEDSPVMLASLSTWEDSRCWKLRDMRLEKVFLPSAHLEGMNPQTYLPIDVNDAHNLKSILKYYKESPDGEIRWGTFSGIAGIGDRTDNPENPQWICQSIEGCWSYKAARTKFKEIMDFWKYFQGTDLNQAVLINPNQQITEIEYRLQMGYLSASN